MNITLSVDDQIVKTVRKIAIDHDTTLTQMVREYLTGVVRTLDIDASEAARRFSDLTKSAAGNQDAGPRKWSRDEMYAQRFNESVLGKSSAARKTGQKAGPGAGK